MHGGSTLTKTELKAGMDMATMQAAVFQGKGKISIREVPRPEPGPGEALVKTTVTTICGTDVHILKGEYPVREGLIVVELIQRQAMACPAHSEVRAARPIVLATDLDGRSCSIGERVGRLRGTREAVLLVLAVNGQGGGREQHGGRLGQPDPEHGFWVIRRLGELRRPTRSQRDRGCKARIAVLSDAVSSCTCHRSC